MRRCVCAWSSPTLRPRELQPTSLLCPWDSPGKNTGVGCRFLLRGTFLTQGSDPCRPHLLHWYVDSLPLSHPGSPSEMMLGIYSAQFVDRRVQRNANTLHPAPTTIHILQLRFIIPLLLQLLASVLHRRVFQTCGSTRDPRGHCHPSDASSGGLGKAWGPVSLTTSQVTCTLGPGHTWSKILKCLDAAPITDTTLSFVYV